MAPESSFTMSPLSTALPLFFCNLGSSSAFFEVTCVHQRSRVDSHFVSLRFQNNLLLALDFSRIPCWICLELLPFLVHGSFCIRYFHCLWQRNTFVNQVAMSHGLIPFACDVILMVFGLQRLFSLSRGLVGFHHTTIHCFELLLMAIFLLYILFHDARILFVSLAGHGWSHRSFQFSSCVADNFLMFFAIRIDKVNPFQLSSIVKLRFLICPFLFLSILSFANFRPNFWTYIIWSGSRVNLCQSAS